MREDARMASWLSSIGLDDRVVVCAIARGEILFGLGEAGSRTAPNRTRRGKPGTCSPYCRVNRSTQPAADRYANVKASQQRRGLPLDENDLWIAATAIAMNATLVSRDSDFQAVEGLALVEP
jgi:tRNA(fMet)-specific endonuclease VapC